MIVTKKNIFILLFVFLASLQAQIVDSSILELRPFQLNQAAKKSEKAGDYYAAISYSAASLEKKPGKWKPMARLAKNYYFARDYKNAERTYKEFFTTFPEQSVIALLYYGFTLQHLEKYDLAYEQFREFKKYYLGKDEKEMKKMARVQMEACQKVDDILTDKDVLVNHVGDEINRAHIDYAPYPLSDSTFIYTSLRVDSLIYKDLKDSSDQQFPTRKFYKGRMTSDGDWIYEGEFTGAFNDEMAHLSNGVFDLDSNFFYFTKCKPNWKSKMICSIYQVQYFGGEWGEPVKLPEPINLKDYTSTQPTIGTESKKGRTVIYFISDRPEGKGGWDMWYTLYDRAKNEYSEVKNCGGKFNSAGDEMSPFWVEETKTMYFSSNGYLGLGGQDIYKVEGEMKRWKTKPMNLQKPINTSYDDMYYVLNPSKKDGYFVSNREGSISLTSSTCCDDIYYFKFERYLDLGISGKVVTSAGLEEFPDSLIALENEVVVKLFKVNQEDGSEELLKTIEPDSMDGSYFLKLEKGFEYKVVTETPGFLSESYPVSTKLATEPDTMIHQFVMSPISNTPIVVENVYYEFDKDVLLPSSKNSIDTTIYTILIDNPQIIVEIGSHTDSKGSDKYNEDLSERRAKSVVDYLLSKGIAQERLKYKGYGETTPIAPNTHPDGTDNPEGRAQNRRTEFKIIGQLDQELIKRSTRSELYQER